MKKKKKEAIRKGRETNLLLSQNVKITYNTWKTKLGSMNTLLIGGTGEGKSRNTIKPNIWSLPTDPKTGLPMSLVFTDPKGELCADTAEFLRRHGYRIKLFNVNDMRHSDCYNPFRYITDDNSLMIVIDALVTNGNGGAGGGKDPYWDNMAKALLNSLAFYVFYELGFKQQSFTNVAALLNMAGNRDEDKGKPSDYEVTLDKLQKASPMGELHPAIEWYSKVRSAQGNTFSSILSSAQGAVRLFASRDVQRLTDTDNIGLDMIGDTPTALYIITSTTNSTYDFLVSMMYTQLFESLLHRANTVYADKGNSLPHHIVFWMDEFANVGQIPDFDKKIAVFRQANISSVIVVQTPNQIESIYEKKADNIIGNNHIVIFLGSGGLGEKSAPEWMSKALGSKTIQVEQTSVNRGKGGGGMLFMDNREVSHSYSATQRPLMMADEVRLLPGDECLVMIKGYKPFRDKKIAPETCLNYAEAKECTFHIETMKQTSSAYSEGMSMAAQIDLGIVARRKLDMIEDAKYEENTGLEDTAAHYVEMEALFQALDETSGAAVRRSVEKRIDVAKTKVYSPTHEWDVPPELGDPESIELVSTEEMEEMTVFYEDDFPEDEDDLL